MQAMLVSFVCGALLLANVGLGEATSICLPAGLANAQPQTTPADKAKYNNLVTHCFDNGKTQQSCVNMVLGKCQYVNLENRARAMCTEPAEGQPVGGGGVCPNTEVVVDCSSPKVIKSSATQPVSYIDGCALPTTGSTELTCKMKKGTGIGCNGNPLLFGYGNTAKSINSCVSTPKCPDPKPTPKPTQTKWSCDSPPSGQCSASDSGAFSSEAACLASTSCAKAQHDVVVTYYDDAGCTKKSKTDPAGKNGPPANPTTLPDNTCHTSAKISCDTGAPVATYYDGATCTTKDATMKPNPVTFKNDKCTEMTAGEKYWEVECKGIPKLPSKPSGPSAQTNTGQKKTSGAKVAGIVIGCLLGGVLVIGGAAAIVIRMRNQKSASNAGYVASA